MSFLDTTDGVIIVIVAALSVSSSLLVVLTFILFDSMRKKLLMKMIAYISLCDFIANIAYIIPYRPMNGTWDCTLQGLLNLTVYPMSWFWTLALVYCLFYLAHYSRIPMHWYGIHMFCWGIPIALTCIAVGFTHIGRLDSFPTFETCSYYGDLAAEIYHIIFYYGLILAIFAVMLYMQFQIHQLEIKNDPRVFNATFIITKTSLYLYPTLLIICWLPHVALAITQYFYPNHGNATIDIAYFVGVILKISHGFMTAIVFFFRSKESRKLWMNFLCPCMLNVNSEEADLERDSASFETKNPAFHLNRQSSNISLEAFDSFHRQSSQTLA